MPYRGGILKDLIGQIVGEPDQTRHSHRRDAVWLDTFDSVPSPANKLFVAR